MKISKKDLAKIIQEEYSKIKKEAEGDSKPKPIAEAARELVLTYEEVLQDFVEKQVDEMEFDDNRMTAEEAMEWAEDISDNERIFKADVDLLKAIINENFEQWLDDEMSNRV